MTRKGTRLEMFHQCHQQEYGVSSDEFEPAFVSLGVTATGKMEMPPSAAAKTRDGEAVKGERQVYFDGEWHACKIYDGHGLTDGTEVPGPAIIEHDHACTVLPPNANAKADALGNLIIDLTN